MERIETVQPQTLRDTAARLRRTTEQCMEAQERIRRAVHRYQEALDDRVSAGAAQALQVTGKTFDAVFAAYANAYRQLHAAAEALEAYERLGR
ncbi:PE domain-containing protein [Ruminococcus sp.]|uniref:PE domain-containing protein n=1 Tax=Ruminococcus sp. TaxID=41978 RepID=UPI0025E3EFE4|nr:PE domain-containing protein [Ruminococcus sp.]MDD7555143.1 PE domain-containing protein [Ruminococcus sp.]MDY4963658.1 PE domain-containing protein [Ruminococcus callidus]